MDLGKNHLISADYKDKGSSPHWELRLFAEMIFVDKTQNSLQPLIYQLKEHALPSYEHLLHCDAQPINLPREAFSLLGTAAHFDRQKKQILLTNKNTVSYQYLVIASGHKSKLSWKNQQFIAGFHALICALRLKHKMPACFSNYKNSEAANVKTDCGDMQHFLVKLPSSTIELVAKPYICQTSPSQSSGNHLQDIHKLLYEVCL